MTNESNKRRGVIDALEYAVVVVAAAAAAVLASERIVSLPAGSFREPTRIQPPLEPIRNNLSGEQSQIGTKGSRYSAASSFNRGFQGLRDRLRFKSMLT